MPWQYSCFAIQETTGLGVRQINALDDRHNANIVQLQSTVSGRHS